MPQGLPAGRSSLPASCDCLRTCLAPIMRQLPVTACAPAMRQPAEPQQSRQKSCCLQAACTLQRCLTVRLATHHTHSTPPSWLGHLKCIGKAVSTYPLALTRSCAWRRGRAAQQPWMEKKVAAFHPPPPPPSFSLARLSQVRSSSHHHLNLDLCHEWLGKKQNLFLGSPSFPARLAQKPLVASSIDLA